MTYHNKPGTSSRVTDPYAGARQDHHRAVLSHVTQAAMSGLGATATGSRPMRYQTAGAGFPRANFPARLPGQLGQTPPPTTDASLSPPPVQDSGLSTGLKIGWGAVAVIAIGLFWFTVNPEKVVWANKKKLRHQHRLRKVGHHIPPVRTLSDDYLASLLARRHTLMKGDAAKLEREKQRRAKHKRPSASVAVNGRVRRNAPSVKRLWELSEGEARQRLQDAIDAEGLGIKVKIVPESKYAIHGDPHTRTLHIAAHVLSEQPERWILFQARHWADSLAKLSKNRGD
jgi:hypothetical protein